MGCHGEAMVYTNFSALYSLSSSPVATTVVGMGSIFSSFGYTAGLTTFGVGSATVFPGTSCVAALNAGTRSVFEPWSMLLWRH